MNSLSDSHRGDTVYVLDFFMKCILCVTPGQNLCKFFRLGELSEYYELEILTKISPDFDILPYRKVSLYH